MKSVYLSFIQGIDQKVANKLLDLCNKAIAENFDEIHLMMSSHGGHVMSGFAIYHHLRAIPIKVTTYNIGSVDSIANIIFLAGQERVATPNSTFLFHGTKWGFASATELTKYQLAEIVDSLNAEDKRMVDVMTSHTKLTATEVGEFFIQGATKDSSFALDKGVVTRVEDISIPAGALIVQV